MPVAVVTGVTGQDGSYLSEFLLKKGYIVFGVVRRSTYQLHSSNLSNVSLMNPNFKVVTGDLTDQPSIIKILETAVNTSEDGDEVIEIYNLAAQSHVGVSFECPVSTIEINMIGPLNILESIRQLKIGHRVKFYQASTSEMFGKVQEVPQTEKTPFYPRSPYGVAKLGAHWLVKNYRESYGIFACAGILFNHESPRRGVHFVTQKIVKALARDPPYVELGNLDAKRDWGHADDYIKAMWLMLQQDHSDDFVVATGEQHSVREFVELVAKRRGLTITWSGSGPCEIGVDQDNRIIVKVNPEFYRPCEVETLIGDSSKIRGIGWTPEYSFEGLVENMCE
jgi:GDPmannose 4,6-dehydratase